MNNPDPRLSIPELLAMLLAVVITLYAFHLLAFAFS